MNARYLRFTVRFPQRMSHGRGERGEPEWPPSPLRLFQALVAAAAARWNERVRIEYAAPALRWLEGRHPPQIVSAAERGRGRYRLYVPDNVGDKVIASWARHRDASIAEYRTEKDYCPVHLAGEEVHYLYALEDQDRTFDEQKDVLLAAARSITHLGWGVDMVVADAGVVDANEAAELEGERWIPVEAAATASLRAPVAGTLDALLSKHDSFLRRVGPNGLDPVPPLSVFKNVGYRRSTDAAAMPFAVFRILKPDGTGPRAFDPLRQLREVAGMVRSAVARAARNAGWPRERINTFVHGKSPDGARPASGDKSPDRFAYLPLPTINPLRVDAIRRVLIAAPPHCFREIQWVRQALEFQELTSDSRGEIVGILSPLPVGDWVASQYVGSSTDWTTVTPVILPGHDGASSKKTLKLLARSIEQAGLSMDLFRGAEIEWRGVGFRPGVEMASRFLPPENLDGKPRYHLRLTLPRPLEGPLAIGGGRFRGFGVFSRLVDARAKDA